MADSSWTNDSFNKLLALFQPQGGGAAAGGINFSGWGQGGPSMPSGGTGQPWWQSGTAVQGRPQGTAMDAPAATATTAAPSGGNAQPQWSPGDLMSKYQPWASGGALSRPATMPGWVSGGVMGPPITGTAMGMPAMGQRAPGNNLGQAAAPVSSPLTSGGYAKPFGSF